MPNEFIIRSYKKGDEEGIVELLDTVFTSGPHKDLPCPHLDHWKWKYLDNPIKKICITVADANGKIIGSSHNMMRILKVGSQNWLSGIGADAAVHPDFRKLGVFNKIRNQHNKLENDKMVKFRSSVSTNPILIERNKRRSSPIFPHAIVELIFYSDPISYLKQLNNSGVQHLIDRLKKPVISKDTLPFSTDIKIEKVQKFDERFDYLWDTVSPHYDYIVVRNSEYLNWRYCDIRGGRYEIFAALEEKMVIGYIVLRVMNINWNYPPPGGYIVDLLTVPNRNDVVDALFNFAIDFFEDKNVGLIRFWGLFKGQFCESLMNLGFVKARDLNIFFSNPSDRENVQLINEFDIQKNHFVYGDHDHI